jgi:hypothetical protein
MMSAQGACPALRFSAGRDPDCIAVSSNRGALYSNEPGWIIDVLFALMTIQIAARRNTRTQISQKKRLSTASTFFPIGFAAVKPVQQNHYAP